MAQINWSGGANAFGPGIYLVEVLDAKEKVSSKGDPMFIAAFGAVEFNREAIGDDVLMLGGKGAGIGLAKLKALGFKGTEPEIRAPELIGRRVWACFHREEYTGNDGNKYAKLKVNIRAEHSSCGYWPEKDKPAGALEALPADEAPF